MSHSFFLKMLTLKVTWVNIWEQKTYKLWHLFHSFLSTLFIRRYCDLQIINFEIFASLEVPLNEWMNKKHKKV